MTNYDTIIIPYGGIDVAFGCHRSCFVATQPWSPNTAARRIWHLDSKGLTSCHGTQQVGKKVMGALCWVRTAMCMPEVAYTINAVPVPPELNCAHSSAFNCAFNVACLLDVMANDTEIIISAYKSECWLQWRPCCCSAAGTGSARRVLTVAPCRLVRSAHHRV